MDSKKDTSWTLSRNLSIDQQKLLLNYRFSLANGDTVSIRDFTSEYLLLDFWFASCLPCLKALPDLEALISTYSHLSLNIIGVNCLDEAAKVKIEKMIRKKKCRDTSIVRAQNLGRKPGNYRISFILSGIT
jgi:hypothetical protein